MWLHVHVEWCLHALVFNRLLFLSPLNMQILWGWKRCRNMLSLHGGANVYREILSGLHTYIHTYIQRLCINTIFHYCKNIRKMIYEKSPTRCNNVLKFYYSIFIWGSTCFGRHTAHHQEPKTSLQPLVFHTWKVVGRVAGGHPRPKHVELHLNME